MTKNHKLKPIEFERDAWTRFERAVDVVAKSPPQHRTKKRAKAKSMGPMGMPSQSKKRQTRKRRRKAA